MFIDLSLIQVKNDLFVPTKNKNTSFERAESGAISAEFYTLLLILNGKRIKYKNYYYFALINDGYALILREKHNIE